VGQFDVEAALRRHLARLTRRYNIKLTSPDLVIVLHKIFNLLIY
jgi:hypothetical protein